VSGPPRFGVEELGPTEGTELDDALDAIAALDAVAGDATVRVGPAFTERVMAAVAGEPSPAPVGFMAPLRRRGILAGFGESVRQAWASIGAGRPAFARATALAYVLVVVLAGTSLVGAATFGAAGALGLLGPHETALPSPEPTLPPDSTPRPATEQRPSVEPTESAEPGETETPEPSDDHGGGGAEPSDDHGGGGVEPSDDHGGGSDGSDDGSGDSGGGSGPSPTDDHSGSDDGIDSGIDSGSGSGSDD
jgi:hypothetical protein